MQWSKSDVYFIKDGALIEIRLIYLLLLNKLSS